MNKFTVTHPIISDCLSNCVLHCFLPAPGFAWNYRLLLAQVFEWSPKFPVKGSLVSIKQQWVSAEMTSLDQMHPAWSTQHPMFSFVILESRVLSFQRCFWINRAAVARFGWLTCRNTFSSKFIWKIFKKFRYESYVMCRNHYLKN